VRKYFELLANAFLDRAVTITHTVAEGDLVCLFIEWTGTHKGAFLGISPSNNRVVVNTADLYQVKDQKLLRIGMSLIYRNVDFNRRVVEKGLEFKGFMSFEPQNGRMQNNCPTIDQSP